MRAGGAQAYRIGLSGYYGELPGAFLVYLILDGLAGAPALSLGLVRLLTAIVRWVRQAGIVRRLESFSITAAVTALWTSRHALLEAAGLPPLNLFGTCDDGGNFSDVAHRADCP